MKVYKYRFFVLLTGFMISFFFIQFGCSGNFFVGYGDGQDDTTGEDIGGLEPVDDFQGDFQDFQEMQDEPSEGTDLIANIDSIDFAGDEIPPYDIPVDEEYDNNLCGGTGISSRLRVTSVDVSPNSVSGGFYQQTVVLSPLPDGSSKVAWNDESGNAHITPLSPGDTRAGWDVVLPEAEISGFVAHADGGAILGVRGDAMTLWRVDNSGSVIFEQTFVGNNDHTHSGDKWIDWWSDCGRLAWSGSQYGVYFGHTQNWGADGNHQGDLYTHVDNAGNDVGGGWSWGCSHSLEVRLVWNGSIFGPVCLSDCYPTKGIHINGYWGTEISSEPSGNCGGGSSANLGGLVPAPDGFFLTFTSPEGRSSTDVVLVHIASSGTPGPKMYITDTPSINETGAKLALYGGNLLVAWIAGRDYVFAVVSQSGDIIEGPETLSTQFDPYDDFINFADGSAGWAYGSGNQISIARLGVCP